MSESFSYNYTDLDGYDARVKAGRAEYEEQKELGLLNKEDLVIQLRDVEDEEQKLANLTEASREVKGQVRVVLDGDYANNIAGFVQSNEEIVHLMADHAVSAERTKATAKHEQLHIDAGIYHVDLAGNLDAEQRTFFAGTFNMSANDFNLVEGAVEGETWTHVPAGEHGSGYKDFVRVQQSLDRFVGPASEKTVTREFFRKGSNAEDVIALVAAAIDVALGRDDELAA